jgi:uncharacterized membrane protein
MNYYDLTIMFKILCVCLIFWLILAYSLVFTIGFIVLCAINIISHWDRLHILGDKFLDLFDKEKF